MSQKTTDRLELSELLAWFRSTESELCLTSDDKTISDIRKEAVSRAVNFNHCGKWDLNVSNIDDGDITLIIRVCLKLFYIVPPSLCHLIYDLCGENRMRMQTLIRRTSSAKAILSTVTNKDGQSRNVIFRDTFVKIDFERYN